MVPSPLLILQNCENDWNFAKSQYHETLVINVFQVLPIFPNFLQNRVNFEKLWSQIPNLEMPLVAIKQADRKGISLHLLFGTHILLS